MARHPLSSAMPSSPGDPDWAHSCRDLVGQARERKRVRAFRAAALINLLVVIPVLLGVLFVIYKGGNSAAQNQSVAILLPFLLTFILGLFVFFIFCYCRRNRWAVTAVLALSICSYLLLLSGVDKRIDLVNPWPHLTQIASRTKKPGDAVIYIGDSPNTFLVYYLRDYPLLRKPNQLIEEINQGGFAAVRRFFIFTNTGLDIKKLGTELSMRHELRRIGSAPLGQSVWLLSLPASPSVQR